jgi:hypothetical protein
MSIFSNLLKIGGMVGAPFTGGASLGLTGLGSAMDKFGGAAGAAGQVIGGQVGGANNAKLAQGQLQNIRDRNAVDLFGTEQNAQFNAGQQDLQRKGFETSNRGQLAKQALIGHLLGGGMQPTQIHTPGIAPSTLQGGLVRSLLSNPEALAAMQTLGGQASTAQATPLQFTGGELLKAPTLATLPELDTGGGTMSTIAKIAQIVGAVSPFLGKKGED